MGLSLKKGDKIYLLRKYIKMKQPSTKLDFKKLKPYEILEKIRLVNFRLQLLKKLRLYLIFHISLLESALGITPLATNEEIQSENNLDVYEVEKLLNIRIINDG